MHTTIWQIYNSWLTCDSFFTLFPHSNATCGDYSESSSVNKLFSSSTSTSCDEDGRFDMSNSLACLTNFPSRNLPFSFPSSKTMTIRQYQCNFSFSVGSFPFVFLSVKPLTNNNKINCLLKSISELFNQAGQQSTTKTHSSQQLWRCDSTSLSYTSFYILMQIFLYNLRTTHFLMKLLRKQIKNPQLFSSKRTYTHRHYQNG